MDFHHFRQSPAGDRPPNIVIGHEAGADLTDQVGVLILGDGIRTGDSFTWQIGQTLFGEPLDRAALLAGDPRAWIAVCARVGTFVAGNFREILQLEQALHSNPD